MDNVISMEVGMEDTKVSVFKKTILNLISEEKGTQLPPLFTNDKNPEIQEEVLNHIMEKAEKITKKPVTGIVFTVPVWFYYPMIKKMADMVQEKGLSVQIKNKLSIILFYYAVKFCENASEKGCCMVCIEEKGIEEDWLETAAAEFGNGMVKILCYGTKQIPKGKNGWKTKQQNCLSDLLKESLQEIGLKEKESCQLLYIGENLCNPISIKIGKEITGRIPQCIEKRNGYAALGSQLFIKRENKIGGNCGLSDILPKEIRWKAAGQDTCYTLLEKNQKIPFKNRICLSVQSIDWQGTTLLLYGKEVLKKLPFALLTEESGQQKEEEHETAITLEIETEIKNSGLFSLECSIRSVQNGSVFSILKEGIKQFKEKMNQQKENCSEESIPKRNDYEEEAAATAELPLYIREEKEEWGGEPDDTVKEVLRDVIPVLDDLDRTFAFAAIKREDQVILKGVAMISRKLENILEKHGVREIPALGQTFNPEWHYAQEHVTDDSSCEQKIVEVYQKGYFYGEKVLRYSKVKVLN